MHTTRASYNIHLRFRNCSQNAQTAKNIIKQISLRLAKQFYCISHTQEIIDARTNTCGYANVVNSVHKRRKNAPTFLFTLTIYFNEDEKKKITKFHRLYSI